MARRNHQQLALALAGCPLVSEVTLRASTHAHEEEAPVARRLRALGTRGRAMPSRDRFGRFVAFPTSDAPSWYVFCTDGYRIPGETAAGAIVQPEPTVRQPLPRAVARSQRPWRPSLTRADLLTYLVFATGIIAMLWHLLHLERPHH